jgi:hypothetical protein
VSQVYLADGGTVIYAFQISDGQRFGVAFPSKSDDRLPDAPEVYLHDCGRVVLSPRSAELGRLIAILESDKVTPRKTDSVITTEVPSVEGLRSMVARLREWASGER